MSAFFSFVSQIKIWYPKFLPSLIKTTLHCETSLCSCYCLLPHLLAEGFCFSHSYNCGYRNRQDYYWQKTLVGRPKMLVIRMTYDSLNICTCGLLILDFHLLANTIQVEWAERAAAVVRLQWSAIQRVLHRTAPCALCSGGRGGPRIVRDPPCRHVGVAGHRAHPASAVTAPTGTVETRPKSTAENGGDGLGKSGPRPATLVTARDSTYSVRQTEPGPGSGPSRHLPAAAALCAATAFERRASPSERSDWRRRRRHWPGPLARRRRWSSPLARRHHWSGLSRAAAIGRAPSHAAAIGRATRAPPPLLGRAREGARPVRPEGISVPGRTNPPAALAPLRASARRSAAAGVVKGLRLGCPFGYPSHSPC